MHDSIYRQTFLANEDWAVSQHSYVLNFMKNQVKYKEAQVKIAASGDSRKYTPEQQAIIDNKLKI